MIGGDLSRREKVRKIFTQVVNSLTVKLEISGPMACLYTLGNPDYYTSHIFVPFYWCAYVKTVLNAWDLEDDSGKIPELNDVKDKVILNNNRVDHWTFRKLEITCTGLSNMKKNRLRLDMPFGKDKKQRSKHKDKRHGR